MTQASLSRYFRFGFVLSFPLLICLVCLPYLRSGSGMSIWMALGVLGVLFVTTAPGSIMLFAICVAAFVADWHSEVVQIFCVVLSLPNAHLMGMVVARSLCPGAAGAQDASPRRGAS